MRFTVFGAFCFSGGEFPAIHRADEIAHLLVAGDGTGVDEIVVISFRGIRRFRIGIADEAAYVVRAFDVQRAGDMSDVRIFCVANERAGIRSALHIDRLRSAFDEGKVADAGAVGRAEEAGIFISILLDLKAEDAEACAIQFTGERIAISRTSNGRKGGVGEVDAVAQGVLALQILFVLAVANGF